MQLIYASRPFGYDDLTLTGILFQARRNNARDGITGALICREDLFLQLLEGPRDVVSAAFMRILRDDCHVEIVKLWSGNTETRRFPQWSMRHDPARSGAGCGPCRKWPTGQLAEHQSKRSGPSSNGWRKNLPQRLRYSGMFYPAGWRELAPDARCLASVG